MFYDFILFFRVDDYLVPEAEGHGYEEDPEGEHDTSEGGEKRFVDEYGYDNHCKSDDADGKTAEKDFGFPWFSVWFQGSFDKNFRHIACPAVRTYGEWEVIILHGRSADDHVLFSALRTF